MTVPGPKVSGHALRLQHSVPAAAASAVAPCQTALQGDGMVMRVVPTILRSIMSSDQPVFSTQPGTIASTQICDDVTANVMTSDWYTPAQVCRFEEITREKNARAGARHSNRAATVVTACGRSINVRC
nr:hypothetical protein CFP56_52767 [Quercus suber]